jgi:hypothetical protein
LALNDTEWEHHFVLHQSAYLPLVWQLLIEALSVGDVPHDQDFVSDHQLCFCHGIKGEMPLPPDRQDR